jgi:hypothetical protein
MPLDIVLGSLVFFYSLSNELLKATKDYFSQETIEMQHLEEVLAKNGTGIKAFIQSLEEACLNFQKQQASIYILS